MSSVLPHIKTIASENAYFVTLPSSGLAVPGAGATGLAATGGGNQILTTGVAAGTNITPANLSFSTAVWSSQGATSTLVNGQGKMLRDMGKTIVSSLRTFRKVQAVSVSATNGVSVGAAVGSVGNSDSGAPSQRAGEEFLTGYIEIVGSSGFSATANPAAVARMG
jgi:hypothetical protein